ncbi:MAG TPA: DNA internalization-related competence protein ComEC/Rec2 [Burkholderiales bacterium]|nr:DNA internalization-related competence protein ComEC/Rec2 [Burkholderiales bacterium]
MTSIYLFAFIAGAWLLQQQVVLPHWPAAAVLVPLTALCMFLFRASRPANRVSLHAAAIVTFAAAGFFWAAAIAHWKLSDELPEIWQGRDIEISGVIAEMVQPNERGVRFVLDVDRTYTLNAKIASRISLMWYQTDNASLPTLHAGQYWRLVVRLHRPHGNANPDGFDFEAWMLERGIRAVGYVRADPAPHLIKPLVWRAGYLLERCREAARAHLQAALGQRPYAGVVVALAIGDQQAIPADQWQVFTRTGVNHLISISGLHITMVASMAVLLILRLWRLSETLMLKLPARRAAAICGLAVAIGYAVLSGFAVPAQRTVYMLAVVAVALWNNWTTRPISVLAAAAALVVVLDPMAVMAPGFWLSFGAVAVIMLTAGSRIGRQGWFRSWIQIQGAVTLALIPLLLALFQQISLVSPLANAFAIPVVSLIVVPLALLAAVIPVDGLAYAAHQLMALCMIVLNMLSNWPAAVWQQHAPPAWTIPIAIAGAIWMLLPKGFPARWLGASLMLPLFLSAPDSVPLRELQLTVLDVGQGLAVVVRTHEHTLLYDTGPAFTEQIDAGGRIVVPYLRASGIRALDAMIISHDHSDHTGGALSVLQAVPTGWLDSSLPRNHALNLALPQARVCDAGQRWEWDGVSFVFLYPQAADYNSVKDNDRSCVLKISSAYGSVLLPGDIEKYSESRLLQSSENLRADVLIAPHHGSRTSSTLGFVTAVAPEVTIFSVGYLNRFGHPHPVVNARYRHAGSRTIRTDASGAVLISMNATGISVENWRETHRKYWTGR